jgi:peptide/nickel transport system ATP-binding protein
VLGRVAEPDRGAARALGLVSPVLRKPMGALLEARNISKSYRHGVVNRSSTVALEPMSLTIADEEPSVTVVAGESGSGKTTLANLLLGITPPTSGRMFYRGKDLEEMTTADHMTFRKEVQAIFQDPFESYNPFHKVDRVLRMPLRKFKVATSEGEAKKLIARALDLVGLRPEETLGRYPHQLSGGQRQRIMVARALVLQPRIIIADEPVSMVDASLRAAILESLLRLNRELGISIVYITHDLTTAYQVGDSAIILYRGAITELGNVDLVIKDPQHPYTKLLVDSIPLADPKKRWGKDTLVTAIDDEEDVVQVGCKFVNRCPFAMPVCREQTPPIFLTDDRRGVACFLYRENPVMPEETVSKLMVRAAPAERAKVAVEGT